MIIHWCVPDIRSRPCSTAYFSEGLVSIRRLFSTAIIKMLHVARVVKGEFTGALLLAC